MATTAGDIHEYTKRLEQEKARIQIRKTISDEDKRLFLSFLDILLSQGMSLGRVSKYADHLKILSEKIAVQTQESTRGLSHATKTTCENSQKKLTLSLAVTTHDFNNLKLSQDISE